MIYDLLTLYREHLKTLYSPETARTYYIRLSCLLEEQITVRSAESIDVSKVIGKLSAIKHRNYFSQSKNAFLHFCEFRNIKLNDEQIEDIRDLQRGTRKK